MIEKEFAEKAEMLFHAKKWNSILFKQFLVYLEDLRKNHEINFDKLRRSLPSEYLPLVDMADYFDSQHYSVYRKRVLDSAGDCFRNLENEINQL